MALAGSSRPEAARFPPGGSLGFPGFPGIRMWPLSLACGQKLFIQRAVVSQERLLPLYVYI